MNLQKSFIVVYRKGGKLSRHERWYYKGQKIEVKNKFKYLGFWTTPSGVWTHHVKTISDQARKALFLLNRIVYGIPGLPHKFLWHLFDVMISPILLYGSEIWGAYDPGERPETVEAEFAKRF